MCVARPGQYIPTFHSLQGYRGLEGILDIVNNPMYFQVAWYKFPYFPKASRRRD